MVEIRSIYGRLLQHYFLSFAVIPNRESDKVWVTVHMSGGLRPVYSDLSLLSCPAVDFNMDIFPPRWVRAPPRVLDRLSLSRCDRDRSAGTHPLPSTWSVTPASEFPRIPLHRRR